MNKRILNEVLKQLRFDPNNDTLVGLLRDVTNDGYYINRAVQLLREAELTHSEERIDECIKLLIIRKAVNYAINTGAGSKVKSRTKRGTQQPERAP